MLKLTSVDIKKINTEALVIPVCEDTEIHDDQLVVSLVNKAKAMKEFKGEKDDEIVFYHPEEVKAKRVIVMGLGKLEKVTSETLRAFAGKAISKCIKKKLSDILFAVPISEKVKLDTSQTLEAVMEGACLGNHLFDKYKNEKKQTIIEQILLLVKPAVMKKYAMLPSRINKICQGTIMAREWVSIPSNEKKPEQFAKSIAKEASKEHIKVTVINESKLKEKKFGAILAVASGSDSKPCMVTLEYRPKGAKKTIALVGKGVTFDAGGINLKPSDGLKDMKSDMAGAAAVAATLMTAAKLKIGINLIGIIPIVENMPSGKATRPGDIIRTYSGKTVEIGNTDAEGRLILVDAISYAIETFKPHTLIDLATLTGACVVALGEKIAGVFSFDNELTQLIIKAGEKTHERCWHLPLPEDYKELFKSEIADINNMSSTRWGGAIVGALFISEFVKNTRWAHIDIAGPSYMSRKNDYCGVGGTGFGVRLLCEILDKL